MPAVEVGRRAKASRVINELKGAIAYDTSSLPEATEFNQGRILWDSETSNYLVSTLGSWETITLNSDALTPTSFQGYVAGYQIDEASPGVSIEKNLFASDTIGTALQIPTSFPGTPSLLERNAARLTNPVDGQGVVIQNNTNSKKFSFISDVGSTENWTVAPSSTSITSNHTNTDITAGNGYAWFSDYTSPFATTVYRIPFSSFTPLATPVGSVNLPAKVRKYATGGSDTVNGYGYMANGNNQAANGPPVNAYLTNQVEKIAFATNTTSQHVISGYEAQGCGSASAEDAMYVFGGLISPGQGTNIIKKITFAGAGTTSDHGNLQNQNTFVSGSSGITDAYVYYGQHSNSTLIDKFPYASTNGAAASIANQGFTTPQVCGTLWQN